MVNYASNCLARNFAQVAKKSKDLKAAAKTKVIEEKPVVALKEVDKHIPNLAKLEKGEQLRSLDFGKYVEPVLAKYKELGFNAHQLNYLSKRSLGAFVAVSDANPRSDIATLLPLLNKRFGIDDSARLRTIVLRCPHIFDHTEEQILAAIAGFQALTSLDEVRIALTRKR